MMHGPRQTHGEANTCMFVTSRCSSDTIDSKLKTRNQIRLTKFGHGKFKTA